MCGGYPGRLACLLPRMLTCEFANLLFQFVTDELVGVLAAAAFELYIDLRFAV